MKTNWNHILGHYKASDYNMGEVVAFAQSTGCDLETTLDLVAAEFPLAEKLEMLETNRPYLAIEPVGSKIDSAAYEQMNTAARLPVFVGGALMPDAHLGYALPVGGVAVLEGALSPSFVGYDIGCRMTLSELRIFENEIPAAIAAIKKIARFGFQTNEGQNEQWHPVLENPLWDEISILRGLKNKARLQLGTSGSGNHFIDLMRANGGFALLTHSGSRGIGHNVATHFMKLAEKICPANTPKGYEYLPFDTEGGQEYWAVMQLMGQYAQACHHVIHARIHAALLMSGVELNGPECDVPGLLIYKIFANVDGNSGFETVNLIENHHNFAWKEGNNFVHRKGATPAAIGQLGIIPGSSGSYSYVVEGVVDGLQANEGEAHLSSTWNSASHGAGRVSSRTVAKARHDAEAMKQHYENFGVELWGVAPDETVAAYKDVESVMQAQGKQVKVLARLKPIFVAMGGLQKSDDGD